MTALHEPPPALPAGAPAPEDRAGRLAAMARLVRRSAGQFSLVLVQYDIPREREAVLRDLQRELGELRLAVARLEPLPGGESSSFHALDELDRRARVADPQGNAGALAVVGYEHLLGPAVSGDVSPEARRQLARALQPLNLGRSVLAERFPRPLFLCLPEPAMEVFVRSAPDLGSWRSGFYPFQTDLPAERARWESEARAALRPRLPLPWRRAAYLEEITARLRLLVEDAVALAIPSERTAPLEARLRRCEQEQARRTGSYGLRDRARAARLLEQFLGATVVQEASDLHGRGTLLHELLQRVQSPECRFLTVWGETGSGKSSLVHAGLVPALRQPAEPPGATEVRHLPVLLDGWLETDRAEGSDEARQPPDPIELVQEQLLCAAGEAGFPLEPVPGEVLELTLRRAAAATGRIPVVILDQFERFFQVYAEREQREPFEAAAQSCAGQIGLPCAFVFVIREDRLGRMTEFDQVGDPLAAPRRFHVPPFDTAAAQVALGALGERAGLGWPPELVAQVVKDRAQDGRVRPVEVQLLAATLAVLEIRTLAAYRRAGGARSLLTAYLGLALEAVGVARALGDLRLVLNALVDPLQARRRLLALDDLQRRTRLLPARLQELLPQLEGAHLVRPNPPGSDLAGSRWELAHDELVRPVLDDPRGVRARVHRLLQEADDASANGRRPTLRWPDYRLVREHAAPEVLQQPGVRSLLRRSLWRYVARTTGLTLAAGTLTLAALQNSTSHLIVTRDTAKRVLVRRGLPWFRGVIVPGGGKLLDTGLRTPDFRTEDAQQMDFTIHPGWDQPEGMLRDEQVGSRLPLPAQVQWWHRLGELDRAGRALNAALKDSESQVRAAALGAVQAAFQARPALAEQALPALLAALKAPGDDPVGRLRAAALGGVQAAIQARPALAAAAVPEILAVWRDFGDSPDGRVIPVSYRDALAAILVRVARENTAGEDGIEDALMEHLRGTRSLLVKEDAVSLAPYREGVQEALAHRLVIPGPLGASSVARLRQVLEQMRDGNWATDRRLYLRMAAWDILVRAAELKEERRSGE